MKKLLVSLAGVAVLATPVAIWSASAPATASSAVTIGDPPECGSHVSCPGDPAPDPRSSIEELCRQHIRCPDGGDGGVDPTPDDGCPIGRPCNYDAPGYEEPDVPPPDDVPGEVVEPKSESKTSTPSRGTSSVAEAKAPKPVKATPRTVG